MEAVTNPLTGGYCLVVVCGVHVVSIWVSRSATVSGATANPLLVPRTSGVPLVRKQPSGGSPRAPDLGYALCLRWPCLRVL
jgi:hypothetical protein